MLVLLFISQIICVIIFALFVLLKNKVSYFGLSILFLQFITLMVVIFFRILSSGISFGFLLYIIFIPAALPNILQFFSTNQETTLKKFIYEFNTKLDQNFFNLTVFNHISFYLSRKLFKKIFITIQKKLYNVNYFVILLFLPYIILVGSVVIDVLFNNKIYYCPILLSVFFLFYRFLLLILRINEYFCEEGLNYLVITFRKRNFEEPIIYFQDTSNLLNINHSDMNYSFLKEHWTIWFTGVSYSSASILSKNLRTIVLPLFFNFFLWILFFFSLALILFSFWQKYLILLVFSILIAIIPLGSFIYVTFSAIFKKIPEIYDLKLFKFLVFKQKTLLEALNIFRFNFPDIELPQNLIIPKNRPPINFIECFNRTLYLIDPLQRKTKVKEFHLFFAWVLFLVVFSYFFYEKQIFSWFFYNFSWFYLAILKFSLVVFFFK